MQHNNYDHYLTIRIWGPANAGKTSLINQFIYNDSDYKDNPEKKSGRTYYTHSMQTTTCQKTSSKIMGNCKFNIIDQNDSPNHGGRDDHNYFTYYSGHIIFIVFDLNDKHSFTQAINYAKSVNTNTDSRISKFLVGNKWDLMTERKIPIIQIKELCDVFDFDYIETSAAFGINIDELFEMAAKIQLTKTDDEYIPDSNPKDKSLLLKEIVISKAITQSMATLLTFLIGTQTKTSDLSMFPADIIGIISKYIVQINSLNENLPLMMPITDNQWRLEQKSKQSMCHSTFFPTHAKNIHENISSENSTDGLKKRV